jgi:predicted nucleic acid-binding protein
MKIFFDTSAWIALFSKKDINHPQAKKYYQEQKKNRSLFYTSDYVLTETYTRFIYDVHLYAALKLREKIQSSTDKNQLFNIKVDSMIRELAWQELKKYSDHKLSFADATIIAIFNRYNLSSIFSFDKHFKEINLPTNLI